MHLETRQQVCPSEPLQGASGNSPAAGGTSRVAHQQGTRKEREQICKLERRLAHGREHRGPGLQSPMAQ